MAKRQPLDRTYVPEPIPAIVEDLARAARQGDSTATPPRDPTDDSGEIARRMVVALDHDAKNPDTTDVERASAYSNLRGLAVAGAAVVARRVIKAVPPFKITSKGQLTTISRIYSVPSHLVTDGNGQPNTQDQIVTTNDQNTLPTRLAARQYVQLDFSTWEILQWLRDHLAHRRNGLDTSVQLLDEILKLKDVYPDCTPREAMIRGGLDPLTLQIDLDLALAAADDDNDPDVGIQG